MTTLTSDMDTCMDMLKWLDRDTCVKILSCLDDMADVIRASAVLRSWHSLVAENGICKQLCLRIFPQLSRLDRVVQDGLGGCMEIASDRDHHVFASFARACRSSVLVNCFSDAVSASSTDNYPEESVLNTLVPGSQFARRASYWSSTGQDNPAVPETLIYQLCSKICVITEINIQFFQAYFQLGHPIYSAQSFRFRIGHPRNPKDNIDSVLTSEKCPEPADDKFVWTYTSEVFPMAQESQLQKFKLPERVLCIGGFLQIELMDRVQRQEADNLFYICVAHVQALGRSLSPALKVDILEPSGMFLLKYSPHLETDANGSDLPEDSINETLTHILSDESENDDPGESDEEFVA